MYLKRLTLSGFKSFADKTDFDFDRGITAIVGPNGCGKSNVVDAFKWVLGEQSAKSLRGDMMLDVIFKGSSSRRANGMAQVDLVFDNTSGRLPIDQTEVTVSRRLYRSGESEYLINKQVVRLKDIRELFMDTGVGRNAYSIIEQGRVDVLLQASPIERRIIFEEAAGISKYKAHRKEALRRLERVEQDLLRVQDIIEEVEKRLRSIKLQAGKARNYQAYNERLRGLRASFSLAEYHRLTGQIAEQDRVVAADSDLSAGLKAEIARCETAATELEGRIMVHDQQISQHDNELLNLQSQITTNQERVSQSHQRMTEAEENLKRVRLRCVTEQQRIADLVKTAEAEQLKAQELERKTGEQAELIQDLMTEDQRRSRELTELQARLDDEKSGIIDLLRRTAQLHNEIQKLDLHRENLLGQKERLSARDADIRRQLEDLITRKAQHQARAAEIAELIKAEMARWEEKKRAAAELDDTRNRLNQELTEAKEHRSGLRSRYELLSEQDRRLEGVSGGVRSILMQRETEGGKGSFAYVDGLVADLMAADVQNATLVETALGDLQQYLVVSDSALLLADQERIAELKGCVRTFCLDRLGPLIGARDFSAMPGYVGNVADMVRCDAKYERLARHLLGKTIVVETIEDALRFSQLSYGSHRFITRTGQIVEPDGRIILGSTAASVGLISRKSQIRRLGQDLEQADQQIAVLADRMSRTSAELEHLERIQQELRQAIYEARVEQTENQGNLMGVAEDIRRLTDEQPLIAGEVQSIEIQVADALQRSSANQQRLDELQAINAEREKAVATLKEQIDAMVLDRRHLSERLTEAKVEAGRLAQQRAGLNERLGTLRQERIRSEAALAAAVHDVQETHNRISSAERAILRADAILAMLFLDKERTQREALGCRRQREMLRAQIEQLAQQLKEARQSLEEVETRLQEARMALHDATLRREGLVTRIREELGIDLAQQYESYQYAEEDWSAIEAEITDLRQKIERLGNVNLDAIAEQDELESRTTFLTTQRDDLIESRKKLEGLIQRLNKEARDRFLLNFEEIRKHFQDLYRKLFGGGRADIVLENTEDVLECGIEIVAKPPGKELQSISLLSGGEKTMTAVALLLGIFKSRPSPFAILDEVDAALDEANNNRFNLMVREFLEHSQFVIITHSKRTMSVADVMYGVTMQEPGVSTRVAVRFENEVDRNTAVA